MPRLVLPRVRLSPRAAGTAVAALLVATLGVAGTAVTTGLRNGAALAQPANAVDLPPSPTATPTPSAEPVVHPLPLSTRPKHLVEATLLVSRPAPLTRHQLRALAHVAGVRRTQRIAAGSALVDGHRGFVIGVKPQSFRPWTPKFTADSNALWSTVTRGELTASFDMGHDARLPLGHTVSVVGRSGVTPVRVGAFASVGLAGVDAVVSATRSRQIGLAAGNAVLVSAPKADPLTVRAAVARIVGSGARTEVLHEQIVTRDAGEFLTRAQISTFLHAAAGRVGAPYVWGAAGPSSFDCSGLVQWSFARAGIVMPRVAQEQFLTGPHVPYADARPGDLLFWHYDPTDRSDIDHVAIYIGGGEMIEAPHTGDVVKLVPVPLSHLAGVVRVDPALAAEIA